jgi:teichoic acid transport system permease protein
LSAKDLYDKRKIITELAKTDFKKRFAGSYFGIFWMFVQPIVTVLIYYCVFQLGFKANPPSEVDAPYVLWLIPGIVPWFYFNEGVNAGTRSLFDYNYLVKKVVFRVSIIPLLKNISCAYVHFIFVYIMLAVFLLYGYVPSVYWIQLLYYSMCAFVLIAGITLITSSVMVFFKDMEQIVNILLQFGMWITPIMWDYHLFGESMLKYLKLNPFFYISEGYRDSMLNHVWFWEKPVLTLYFWLVALLIFAIGTALFKRLRPHFADVL